MRYNKKIQNFNKYNENLNDSDINDSKIIWKVVDDEDNNTDSDNIYHSDRRSEFIIYKKDRFWILSYTDFWTASPLSFFINVKSGSDEKMAVPELKCYAQKVFDEYKKRPKIEVKF